MSSDSFEARLRRLEDREEIKELVARYGFVGVATDGARRRDALEQADGVGR